METPKSKRARKRLNNKTNKANRLGITISQLNRESMNDYQYERYHAREREFLSRKCADNPDLSKELVEDLCKLPKKYPKVSTEVFEKVKNEYNNLFTVATFFQNSIQIEDLDDIYEELSSSSISVEYDMGEFYSSSSDEVVYVKIFVFFLNLFLIFKSRKGESKEER